MATLGPFNFLAAGVRASIPNHTARRKPADEHGRAIRALALRTEKSASRARDRGRPTRPLTPGDLSPMVDRGLHIRNYQVLYYQSVAGKAAEGSDSGRTVV